MSGGGSDVRDPGRWSRRAVLAALAVGGGTLVVGGAGLWSWWRGRRPGPPDTHLLIGHILARRAPYARLDAATVERLATDFMASTGGTVWSALRRLRYARVYGTWAERWVVGSRGAAAIERAERAVVTAALLSTGFFDAQPYGSGSLVYRGWPLVCGSPFAARGAP